MILQALVGYYERKTKAGEAADGLPPLGMEENNIGFVIVLDKAGLTLNIEDMRVQIGRQKKGRPMIVPASCDRTGKNAWKTAFLLWDHPRYVLGVLGEKDEPEMAEKRISSFRSALDEAFPDAAIDPGVHAVKRFYERFDENIARLRAHTLWTEIEGTAYGVSFRLNEIDGHLVSQSPLVVERARKISENDSSAPVGQCLIEGRATAIQILHAATPLPIAGSKSTAKILSFNERSYESYGKRERKGENAPVGKLAAFAYTTALNHLLARQKLRIGSDVFVFWATRETSLENEFAFFFDEPHKDAPDPDRGTRAVAALFEAAKQGVGPVLDEQTRFFVLGLAPNAARIVIRFWHVGTVAQMAERIVRHFRDLEMVWVLDKRQKENGFLPITRLLKAIAAQEKIENVPPNLGGEVMRAILEGTPYPETLLHGAIRRIRAGELVSYPRAAILKACLNRTRNSSEEKIKMSLDPSNTHPGYRLGRLFAVLERIQEEAAGGHGKINATIRDRFYGAASSTPATVFPLLMRLKNHHLGKIENVGRRRNLESLLGEIINGLPPRFEPHLSMDGQGRFAVGYYQQRVHSSTYGKQGV